MRLINSATFELEDFLGSELPRYAILSHCWSDTEDTYRYFQRLISRKAFHSINKKILDCCSLAREAGLDWVWVDTCCIDKSSSAELSEAINSMFDWYKRADVCYVFLADLDMSGKDASESSNDFSHCRWFTRGWTLQELTAPRDVRFFDKQMKCVGTKESLAEDIASVTKIPVGYLIGSVQIQNASVAQRMSWASKRSTSRVEDMAYCLLGLFDVNIPLLYGENDRAFRRLQQAIISQSDDESIFAWLSEKSDSRGC